MPASPKKCWGKNVKFTPTNITPKWAFAHVGCRVYPVNRGNQWVNPARIAKTAPIDRT